MSNDSRRQALEAAGLAHPRPEAVTSPLFGSGRPVLFQPGQGASQVRDVAGTWSTAGTVTEAASSPRLFPGRVLLGRCRFRGDRHDRVAGKAAGPERARSS